MHVKVILHVPFKNLRNLLTFDLVKDQSPRHYLHVFAVGACYYT